MMPRRLAIAAATLLVLSGFAFWPQYLSRLAGADGFTHTHALLGTCWLLLLIIQPLLFQSRAMRLHRTLGRMGVVAGAAFFVTGILTAHRGLARMTEEQLALEGYFVYVPLVMTLIFGAALLLGVLWRSVPALHSRFMACTLVPLLDPVLARILHFYFPPLPADFLYQVPAFILATIVLAMLAVTIPGHARGAAVFRFFSAGSVVLLLLYFMTPYSSAWFSFVQWFHALPVT
jgi:hypothetical protein